MGIGKSIRKTPYLILFVILGAIGISAVSAATITLSGTTIVEGTMTADDYFDTKNTQIGINANALGGTGNIASGNHSTVGGGRENTASGNESTVGGGFLNTASGNNSTISGGEENIASGSYSTVGGGGGLFGSGNTARGDQSTISGGGDNIANGTSSTVGGGTGNTANGTGSIIGGGGSNTAIGDSSTVGGGVQNNAIGSLSTIGGGYKNTASESGSTVSGGNANIASEGWSTIGGGTNNIASGQGSTVGGGGGLFGSGNIASGNYSAVGGGIDNTASGFDSTISGGLNNTASGDQSTVGGGVQNNAIGITATVPGGSENDASGDYSFAAGRRAHANHTGAIVFADSTNSDYSSTANDQFSIRAAGGIIMNVSDATVVVDTDTLVVDAANDRVGIGTDTPTNILEVKAASGTGFVDSSGNFVDGSSRAYKDEIRDLDLQSAQQALKELDPVRYFGINSAEEEHLGFIAEDVPDLVAHTDRKGLRAMDIVAVLTKVVQEQQVQIESLKSIICEGNPDRKICH